MENPFMKKQRVKVNKKDLGFLHNKKGIVVDSMGSLTEIKLDAGTTLMIHFDYVKRLVPKKKPAKKRK